MIRTDHLKQADGTRKGQYIQEIIESGAIPSVSKIIEDLSEEQAYTVELELITTFGILGSGGLLYNSVIPKTVKRNVDRQIVVALGTVEKAQLGLKLLKDLVISLAEENPSGITNSDCAHYLGLQSDNEGRLPYL